MKTVPREAITALKMLLACFDEEGALNEQYQDQLSVALEKGEKVLADYFKPAADKQAKHNAKVRAEQLIVDSQHAKRFAEAERKLRVFPALEISPLKSAAEMVKKLTKPVPKSSDKLVKVYKGTLLTDVVVKGRTRMKAGKYVKAYVQPIPGKLVIEIPKEDFVQIRVKDLAVSIISKEWVKPVDQVYEYLVPDEESGGGVTMAWKNEI